MLLDVKSLEEMIRDLPLTLSGKWRTSSGSLPRRRNPDPRRSWISAGQELSSDTAISIRQCNCSRRHLSGAVIERVSRRYEYLARTSA